MAGCYEALIGGQTGDAMVDFTGGADEYLDLVGGGHRGDDEKTKALFKVSSYTPCIQELILLLCVCMCVCM